MEGFPCVLGGIIRPLASLLSRLVTRQNIPRLSGYRRRFEAINVAMGNSRSSPYSFCVDAHAGIDADIVSWEMVRTKICAEAATVAG